MECDCSFICHFCRIDHLYGISGYYDPNNQPEDLGNWDQEGPRSFHLENNQFYVQRLCAFSRYQ